LIAEPTGLFNPASANSIWIWNGQDDLLLIQVTDKGASKFISSKVVPDLTNRAPAEVIQQLTGTAFKSNPSPSLAK